MDRVSVELCRQILPVTNNSHISKEGGLPYQFFPRPHYQLVHTCLTRFKVCIFINDALHVYIHYSVAAPQLLLSYLLGKHSQRLLCYDKHNCLVIAIFFTFYVTKQEGPKNFLAVQPYKKDTIFGAARKIFGPSYFVTALHKK